MAKYHQVRPVLRERESDLMLPSEVAALFRVDPKTVTRWAKAGKLACVRTLGGHRRYWRAEVDALVADAVDKPDPMP